MEHPLISNLDNLTIDELSKSLSELNQKLVIAYRTGNSYLCDQIRMAIESYQTKLTEKQRAQYDASKQNFNDKINIS